MTAHSGTEGLQPQDLVLTIFGAQVRGGELVWSGGLVEVLRSLGVTTASARASLARLVNRELLARTREGRLALYSLTQRAERLLAEGDSRIFGFGRPRHGPETWTVVWHTLPESERVARSGLATRLRFLGFGPVQDATWVASHDRREQALALVSELGIERHACVLTGQMAPELPPLSLVAQTWQLDRVAESYRAFLTEFEPLRRRPARRALSDTAAFRAHTLMLHRFRGFPLVDPELPAGYDPVRNQRAAVVACLDDVSEALRERASAWFWSVARSPLMIDTSGT
jgi:phenylacetic acid degradation operon negative regulatory protein